MTIRNINSLLPSVPKLMGKNYQDWKFAVQMVMHRVGCLALATGKDLEKPATHEESEQWEKLLELALTIIGLTINPDQYDYIQNTKTSPKAWSTLQEAYEKNTRENRITLKCELYTAAHDPNTLICQYTNHITNLVNRLQSISVILSDDDIINVLIINLHPSWASIATSLSTSQTLELTEVVSALTALPRAEASTAARPETRHMDVYNRFIGITP
ncbi:hypothetical protein FKP32DRAFT_1677862 [Trametes sanguinea]|nr:hypothetical protein FKP32DRAFT_1677862 [Trametes sanguinea]